MKLLLLGATGRTGRLAWQQVRVSFNGTPAPRLTIARATVARFLIETVETGAYRRQSPTISGEKFNPEG